MARNTAVAVLKRMDGDEPKMRDSRLEDWINRRGSVEPVDKGFHFGFKLVGVRRTEVNSLAPDGAGHDLHLARFLGAPLADGDLIHATASGGEQRGMPGEETVLGQWLVELAGGIKHHFDDAFHVAAGPREAGYVEAKPSSDRRPNLIGVQSLSLDG